MISSTWQLQEAKNKLSEVIENALSRGPQIITRRGVEVAVVLSYEEYSRLRRPQPDLVEFFRSSPLVGADVEIERDHSPVRDEAIL